MWTGTCAAALGWAVAFGAAVLVDGRPGSRRFWAGLALVVAAAAALGTALDPYGDPTFRMVHSVGGADVAATADGVSSGRVALWAESLRVWAGRPWLG